MQETKTTCYLFIYEFSIRSLQSSLSAHIFFLKEEANFPFLFLCMYTVELIKIIEILWMIASLLIFTIYVKIEYINFLFLSDNFSFKFIFLHRKKKQIQHILMNWNHKIMSSNTSSAMSATSEVHSLKFNQNFGKILFRNKP